MTKYRVYNIDYDISGIDQDAMEGVVLPNEMVIDDANLVINKDVLDERLLNYLCDTVSDITHFCVNSLEYEVVK